MLRRDFLVDVTRLAALSAVVPNDWRVVRRLRLADDPFQLGVASGDPTPTSAIIWTRLAPRPQEPDGGMPVAYSGVDWEVADDEGFTKVVKKGRATAAPELSYSIHVDVDGLESDRWYFYRFRTRDAVSPVGRLRTAPAAGATTQPLRFAFASCQHYEQGLYTAYAHMAREEIDLVAHLGDYIYEYGPTAGRARLHTGLEIRTLDDYRRRYALYKADPLLQAAHARAPWVVTWDDHEVDNNYAGDVGENVMESVTQMLERRAAAYQAWWEHQPVRVPRARSWADLSITRTMDWGGLARFWVLDSRQYRSDQACGDGIDKVPCGDWASPSRTMLGAAQERWLNAGLAANRPRWQVLANQTMLASVDSSAGPDRSLSMDSWSGYPAAQSRLVSSIAQHAPNRTIVITGDNHANWVNEIRGSVRGQAMQASSDASSVAVEFLGTSITSGGDGSEKSSFFSDAVAAENPQVKWQNNRRGYVVCEVTPDTWRAEFRTLEFVRQPDCPVATPTKWRVERGRSGVVQE